MRSFEVVVSSYQAFHCENYSSTPVRGENYLVIKSSEVVNVPDEAAFALHFSLLLKRKFKNRGGEELLFLHFDHYSKNPHLAPPRPCLGVRRLATVPINA